jgi:glutamate-1-semialdehyde aminotransferase
MANNSDLEMFSQMYREMAKEGVFLPPSQFEGTFLYTLVARASFKLYTIRLNAVSNACMVLLISSSVCEVLTIMMKVVRT